MPLIFAASGSIALSNASGPSRTPPVICPRSAILQSAAASMVEGILAVTVSTAERIATRGVPRPTWVNRSIAFCTMSRLASRSGKMLMAASVMKSVSRYVGTSRMKTWLIRRAVRRPVLLEVTSSKTGLRTARRISHVQAALHQQLAFGLVDQLDRFCRRGVAVGHVDDLETVDVETMLTSDGRNLGSGPHEDRFDDPGFRRLDGAAQRRLFARMNDDGRRRRDLLGSSDQPLVFRSGRIAHRADRSDVADLAVLQHEPSSRTFASATLAHDAFACSCRADEITVRFGTMVAASSRPNAPATRCMRLVSSSESGPRALMTCLMSSYALRRVSASAGSIEGRAASAASESISRR